MIYKMLCYERIDVSRGIDVNKINASNNALFGTAGIL